MGLDAPNWEASSHHGPAIVRAPDEPGAREAAQCAFDVKTRFRLGQGVRIPPWSRAAMVWAEHVHDPRFDDAGPTEFLEPAFRPSGFDLYQGKHRAASGTIALRRTPPRGGRGGRS